MKDPICKESVATELDNSIFFFQAEDGIRDRDVTGVQTCALPILIGCAMRHTASSSRPSITTGTTARTAFAWVALDGGGATPPPVPAPGVAVCRRIARDRKSVV